MQIPFGNDKQKAGPGGCPGLLFGRVRYLLKSTVGATLFWGLPLKYSLRTW
jgi:hypothetical protein